MKNYIKHIVEDFNFDQLKSTSQLNNILLQEMFNNIFKKFIYTPKQLTDEETKLFYSNIEDGYTFKYEVKDNDELHHIIAKTDIADLNWLNTHNVTDMGHLFTNMNTAGLLISEWDTSNVTAMDTMFTFCRNFNSDISKWNTHNVKDMNGMFYGCFDFNQDISNWDVSNVKNMSHMFQECLTFNQDISKWDVSSVENMAEMFNSADKFDQDISSWNISNVTDMRGMFLNNRGFLQDLSNWDLENVQTYQMFANSKMFDIHDHTIMPKHYKK